MNDRMFFETVARNDLARARSMLEAHPELAKAGEGQGTALHAAAKAGNLDMIRLLLEFGADVNAEAHYHESPLTFAAQKGHVEAMKLLREHGVERIAWEFGGNRYFVERSTRLMAIQKIEGGGGPLRTFFRRHPSKPFYNWAKSNGCPAQLLTQLQGY